jgi:diacylglycerol kinase (ATP)
MIADGARRLNVLILAVNPASGKGRARALAEKAQRQFAGYGLETLTVEGEDLVDFRSQLERSINSNPVSGVVAFGGDGFIHEVIQHCTSRSLPMGVIPCGTGNDFARSLGIYKLSLRQQVDLIAHSLPRSVDLGQVGDRWFAAILSSGFDALVNERANQMRWPKGRMKYNIALIEKLFRLQTHRYRITMDDSSLDVDAVLITIANGSSYGGGMRVCPDATITDGLFDVMILHKVSRLELLKVFPKVYFGKHVGHPAVTFYRTQSITVDGSGSAFADGEPISSLPLTARCLPDALLAWAA